MNCLIEVKNVRKKHRSANVAGSISIEEVVGLILWPRTEATEECQV